MTQLIRKGPAFLVLSIVLVVLAISHNVDAFSIPRVSRTPQITYRSAETAVTSMSMTNDNIPDPISFREAEVLGLRLMQEGSFEEALVAFKKGMKLPGSRPDVIRSRSASGPSPVGGSFGGTDSQKVMQLDDFELQAVYYNMACANSRLGNISESIVDLEKAFQNGFDNYSTVRGDPDLDPIKKSRDYEKLMDTYDGKGGGFNPFGLFSKK